MNKLDRRICVAPGWIGPVVTTDFENLEAQSGKGVEARRTMSAETGEGSPGAQVERVPDGVPVADPAVKELAHAGRHGLKLSAPCPNCQTPLQGPWCYICGQKGELYHRSIRHLVAEALEGLTHADSRLWQTLDGLVRRPGRLTREYLDGKRASQIPPFRMFLVVVLTVFLAGSIGNLGPHRMDIRLVGSDSQEVQKFRAEMRLADAANRAGPTVFGRWVVHRVSKAVDDPEQLAAAMERWAHQFAILSLLVVAPILMLLFAFQREFFAFDHLVFAMHTLTAQGLLLAVGLILSGWLGSGGWLFWPGMVHLFFHMRKVYGCSVTGTLARQVALVFGSVLGFGILLSGLFLIGLASVH
jgi:hypothetical protein